jgi:hypothetical protein
LLDAGNGNDFGTRKCRVRVTQILFWQQDATHAGLARGVELLDDPAHGTHLALN